MADKQQKLTKEEEEAKLRTLVAELVAQELAPIKAELAKLEEVLHKQTRQHAGHRTLEYK